MKNYMREIIILVLMLVLLTSCTPEKSTSGKMQQTLDSSEQEVEKADETTIETESETTETTETTKIQNVYGDILLYPEEYKEYYAVSENIPSDVDMGLEIDIDGTEPYYFTIQDINTDGTDELLLGYGEGLIQTPRVLLNILQYDEETDSVIDLDGDRTYPIMDNLLFYTSGYFSTQNEVSDLYTECWRLDDEPDHYWYGWERGGEFYDSDNQTLELDDYYAMVGPLETSFSLSWKKVTNKIIKTEIFQKK